MSQPSAKEIAERILEPSEERNSLTWEQIQNLARAYLELEKEHEELKRIKICDSNNLRN